MKLDEPVLTKAVVDYDFLFTHGVKLPLTLDLNAGDSVTDEGERFVVHLVAKPSKFDPEEILPAETAYVYKANLLTYVIRERQQRIPTPEEQFDMKQAVQRLAKTTGAKTVQ